MSMDLERFVEEASARAALSGPEQAERVLVATLGALGQRLVAEEADALANELPAELAEPLRRASYVHDFEPDELYERVARREGTSIGFAREHAEVVCQLLAEAVSPDVLLRLRKHLGAPWAELFVRRPPSTPPAHVVHREPSAPPRPRTTLSEGHPGSRHPVSVSRLDRAQTHSVARSDDPHGDTKLSSSHGLTQERQHDTLAEGQPGRKRPISEG
jgi:uncharacterized protein (DUF2267 family)